MTDPSPDLAAISSRRERIVLAAALVVGALLLAATVNVERSSALFVVAGIGLATVWVAASAIVRDRGRVASRPLGPDVAVGVAVALTMFGAFVVAAALARHIGVLEGAIDDILSQADDQALAWVIGLTAINAVAEEVFFRGALMNVFPPSSAVGGLDGALRRGHVGGREPGPGDRRRGHGDGLRHRATGDRLGRDADRHPPPVVVAHGDGVPEVVMVRRRTDAVGRPTTEGVDTRATHDRGHPRTDSAVARAAIGRLAPDLDEDVVGDAFGHLRIPEHPSRQPVDRAAELVVERTHRLVITLGDTGQQRLGGRRSSDHERPTARVNDRGHGRSGS